MKLRKGDILAYEAKDWITFMTMGKYNHIAGISEIHTESIDIIESHYASKGVVEVPLGKEYYNRIDVYRTPGRINSSLAKQLINGMRKYYVGKIPYDAPSFPSKFLRSTMGRFLPFGLFRKGEPIFNNKKAFDCAETWATAYKRFLGINIIPEVHHASCTPSDYGRTKGLEFIGKLTDLL